MKDIKSLSRCHEEYLNNNTNIYLRFLETIDHLCGQTEDQDSILLSIEHDPWLLDHRPRLGVATLPMMGMVDLMAQQLLKHASNIVIVEIQNFKAHEWVVVDDSLKVKVDIKELKANTYKLELKSGDNTLHASGTFVTSDSYQPPKTPVDNIVWKDYQKIASPYESYELFHGPAFQLGTEFYTSKTGAAFKLKCANGLAPIGVLNMPLLDASLHSTFLRNFMFWTEHYNRSKALIPGLITKISFYQPTPSEGEIEVKFDYLRTTFISGMCRFKAAIFCDQKLWCQYEIIFAEFDIDRENFSNRDYYNFSDKRKYIPDLTIAKPYHHGYRISESNWKAANWPLGNISKLYSLKSRELSQQIIETLVKDMFSDHFEVHPSLIRIVDEKTATYADMKVNFSIEELENGFYSEITSYIKKSKAARHATYKLGDPAFTKRFNVRYPYIVGEMANGIAGVELVKAAAKNRILGFLGTAGLPVHVTRGHIEALKASLGEEYTFGANLIHNPFTTDYEQSIVDLYLEHNIKLVSASAFMDLSLPLVEYGVRGLRLDENNRVVRHNILIPKLSRVELAKKFMSPAPAGMLQKLLEANKITKEEAELAAKIPIASYITVEADSGGHSDNRPLTCLLPAVKLLAAQMREEHQYDERIKIGAGGGIGTPYAVLGAFSLDADYILTGSINQCSVEANQSLVAKEMLLKASMTDVMMAPAADMFEQGINVQVLKKTTMFPMRAKNLYKIYSQNDSIDDIPAADRQQIEVFFKENMDNVWSMCEQFFLKSDPSQLEKASENPKHKMALIFRWYLGNSSKWAMSGDMDRKHDFQIWCGPAMGAFNQWVKGTPLENLENRSVVQIAHNLMYGAETLSENKHYSPKLFNL